MLPSSVQALDLFDIDEAAGGGAYQAHGGGPRVGSTVIWPRATRVSPDQKGVPELQQARLAAAGPDNEPLPKGSHPLSCGS